MKAADPLEPFWEAQDVVVLDGGLATELERRGADLRGDLWSARLLIQDPDAIRRLHYDYFAAGADVAVSASYQASLEGFARRGLSRRQSEAVLQSSVVLAQEARELFWEMESQRLGGSGRVRPLVAASVGSYGAYLADGSEYRGGFDRSVRELKEWHRPRIEALLGAAPDLLACETIPCPKEGEALCELLEEYEEARAWLSFSCADGSRICSGEPLASCARLADGCLSLVAVGVNCTAPAFVASLLQAAGAATDKPLVCYPNRGGLWDAAARAWLPEKNEPCFAALAEGWKEAGARLIGGCCRTSPEDVSRIRELLL